MPGNYRVEVSSTGRAACQSTECKKTGVKIDKGVLRLGVWVELQDHGSWRWRHWGCVTGKVLENMRKGIEDPDKPGIYRWDYLDGYDGEDKHGLQGHPELQEKVRRVISQGFIDAEDWKGDPEMNKLGETGMRTKETMKKRREEQKAKEMDEQADALKEELANAQNTSKGGEFEAIDETKGEHSKPTSKKRKQAGLDDEDEEVKPAQKKRTSKSKKEQDVGQDDEEAKPVAPKKRASKPKKEQDAEEDKEVKPAAKKRAAKPKKAPNMDEEADKPDVKSATKKSRGKKVKDEVIDENTDHEEFPAVPAKKSRSKPVKKEEDVEANDEDDEVPPKKAAVKKASGKKIPAKKGGATQDLASDEENGTAEIAGSAVPKKRVARGKKAPKLV